MPLGSQVARNEVTRDEAEGERAFLVGLDVRTRGRSAKGTVTAQAAAARDAVAMQPAKAGSAGAW